VSEYEEITGGGGDYEERELVRIGLKNLHEFEGVFRGQMSPVVTGEYGPYRVASFDTPDGRKVKTRANVGSILLDRLETANLSDGDAVKIVVEPKPTKDGKRTYGHVRLFVNRGAAADSAPKAAPPVADDNPPF